jgi:hypothetical protein
MTKKQIIRITESDVQNMVMEAVRIILKEDGEMATMGGPSAGGATNACGTGEMGSGQYTVPFGKIQRRKIGAKSTDDITKQESNVDMTPVLNRKDGKGGSISIPKRRK